MQELNTTKAFNFDSPTPFLPEQQKQIDSWLLYRKLKSREALLPLCQSLREAESLNIKLEHSRVTEELKRVRVLPLSLGHFNELIDNEYGIVGASSGQTLLTRIMSSVERDKLKPNATVALHRQSSAVIGVVPSEKETEINAAAHSTRMLTSNEIGSNKKDKNKDIINEELAGYEVQQQELREALELPLEQPEIFTKLGIEPPKGVLLYGPPGTGKTLAARCIARKSKVPFIRVVASEFVQKYLGEGPRMVRDVFRLAREKAPCVIFIDEIDAVAQKRFDSQTGADKEVQRILIELLTQMDGFDVYGNVKVVMATNRIDTLDPALLRPGRLDRKIEFPYPNTRARRLVYRHYIKSMGLAEDVDIEKIVKKPVNVSGADIRSICMGAGMNAIRNNRYLVNMDDFENSFEDVTKNIGSRNEMEGGRHSFYK